jgi:parallel beta-helix repeat protein
VHASRADGILVALAGNEGNVVRFNRVTDAGRDGIGVWDDAARTEVYRNRVTGSTSDGIFVISGGGTIVEGNRTDGNLNGIHISRAETTVTANRANYNIEYGIRAGLPVTDGGHNRARGNGASPQCLNVVCK